ncbi:bifunctional helix-turn-helix transcriptional regulator/GNAT family N-acetyltransferase [Phytohabitans suffuscus]|uniref:Putative transcriptional regulator, MarR family protein n=1 Tax=Phytohabitans suffuscus TaxID=624315 RepID=A0A6F8YZT5_9ACTN|nr:bifunctional helix-turn-helix transcriptional regulator/GNAT family N-acetyltransferase [Phytohabitans suffuscus]BCB91602.1 putative transcriptional regulator, MarR family protein [Phytohabitans suffuscus]
MDSTLVARVRRFNRTVTHRIGALDDAYLARGRPLGQCRVLWEIGDGGSEVRALRARLDLDSGYLSRLLAALRADGLVEVAAAADGRVRTVRLTPAGAAERDELDRRSDDLATDILAPLDEAQRGRLVTAMGEVERLLVASMVRVAPADPDGPESRACVEAYAAELAARFDGGFDPARSIPAAGALMLVASLHGEAVGCGALVPHGSWAAVKRMWVAPSTRGLGLGRRMLAELEATAATRGVRTLRLETNRALTEAIALYRSARYREVPAFNDEPYAHHWFEKDL